MQQVQIQIVVLLPWYLRTLIKMLRNVNYSQHATNPLPESAHLLCSPAE